MKKIALLSIASLLLIGTGCEKKKEEKPKETFKSYEYYKAHTKEMFARTKECKKINYEKSYAVEEDCGNALAALHIYNLRHDKD